MHFWGETETECFRRAHDVLELPAFVAQPNGELVGFMSYSIAEDALTIVMLNVLPEHQRAGVGRDLLTEAVERANHRGLSRLVVATSNDNLPALDFYQRNGFIIESILPGRVLDHHQGLEKGFGGVGIRDELRLQLLLTG